MTQTLTTKVLNDFITGQGYGVAPSAVEAMARELLANREAQPVICDIERIKRHALPAGECPKQSQVVLLSSLKRLLTAPPAPAVPDEMTGDGVLAMHDCGYIEGWNACRAAMLAQPQNEPQNIPKNIPGDLPAAVNRLLDSDGSCGCFSAIRCSDAREEVERLLAQPVSQGCIWIACGEQLPAVGETVLVSSDGYVSVGELERSGANYRYFTSVATGRELTVTHWMPLPAAPEGGNDA